MTDLRDFFICHASEDKVAARNLARDLEAHGLSVWIDQAEVRPGDVLIEKLTSGLLHSRWSIVLLSANSSKKGWVRFEMLQAIDQEIRDGEVKVIPVVLQECDIPPSLRTKVFVDLTDFGNYERGLQQLVQLAKADAKDIPSNFLTSGVAELSELEVFDLPRAQAVIETNLRADRWVARTIRTLARNSGLTQKQVITYCERMPHIALSPEISAPGQINYGRADRVMPRFSGESYVVQRTLFLEFIRRIPSERVPPDVVDYFLSFYSQQDEQA